MTTELGLFAAPAPPAPVTGADLGQFPTPAWAADALVRSYLPDLTESDFVLEPTCGPGRFLAAIPPHVAALGVEIDPHLANQARTLTGRTVITGDFRTVDITERPTVVVGNPPFETRLIEQILDKVHGLLVDDGRVCFVLPAYFFQTARRVVRYSEQWSISQQIVPRNLYRGLKHPLVVAEFTKDQQHTMIGFALFHELAYLQGLPKSVQDAMTTGPSSWPTVVRAAITDHGGQATLSEIYAYVVDRRPTANPAWREQVRKVCRTHAERIGPARYATRTPEPR